MALSPNAPDYVSQVRGVISDLRNDYLKKQQLFQDDQQAAARNALGYAQINAQRENQALQADLDQQRIEAQKLASQANLENTLYERERQFAADEAQKERYAVEKQQKDLAIAESERKRQDDIESGRLFAMKQEAINSNDPDRILAAQAAIDNSTISGAARIQLAENLDKAMDRKFKMDEMVSNRQKKPQANALILKATNLPLDRLSTEDSSQILNDLESQFLQLGITDDTNKQFATVLSQKNAQLAKLANDTVYLGIQQLNSDGAQGNVLSPKRQETYDAIRKQYPDYNARMADPDSFSRLRGLAKDINEDTTREYLEDTKTRFMLDQKNLVEKNPSLGVETTDPVTGEKRVTFIKSMPSMNLTKRDIDPRTGTLSKAKQEEINSYDRALARAMAGDINPLQNLLGQAISAAPPNPNIKKLQFIPNIPYDTTAATGGVPAGTPGTAAIPAAPPERRTRPSDEQIMAMGSDPKTADQLIPGTRKTYREAAKFLADQNKNSQGKSVANPNTY
jgi:hypothetical protein